MRFLLKIAVLFSLLTGCESKEYHELSPPGNEEVVKVEYQLQNMLELKYWQNNQMIRLQSGVIQLYPASSTYIKKFLGTPVNGDPTLERWSVEESGNYHFSTDSAFLFFSNDHDTAFYSKGYTVNGIWYPPQIQQNDSLWYSDFVVTMGVTGKFIYMLK